jgi:N-acetylneuraminic acid mutarotase
MQAQPFAARRLLRFLVTLCLTCTWHSPAHPAPVGPTWPPVERDLQARLGATACDSLLEPWQREFTRRLACGARPEAAEPSVGQGGKSATLEATFPMDGGWQELPLLTGRDGQTAVYDSRRARLVVFGGWDGASYRNDVWALSLTGAPAWTRLQPGGRQPAGRVGHSAVYDPARDRMLVFGGYSFDGTDHFLNDLWELSLSDSGTWFQLDAGLPAPAGRCYHSAVCDSLHDRMLVFGGGYNNGTPQYLNDVWALSLANDVWTQLATAGVPPHGRYAHSAIYDPLQDAMVCFGGYYFQGASNYVNDVWSLSFGTDSSRWSLLPAAGTPPAGRAGHTAVWDRRRDRMVVFGGDYWNGSYHFLDDAWTIQLGRDSASWTPVTTPATSPPARSGHAAIYDPVRDSMLVCMGYSYDGAYTFHADVWTLSLSGTTGWSVWDPVGSPPPGRDRFSAVCDPLRDRVLVFGGHCFDGSERYFADVWALTPAAVPGWSPLAPAGAPPASRLGHSAVLDPVRDRMLVFGGYYYDGAYHYLNDVWALKLGDSPEWVQLAPAGTPPSARSGHVAVYDPLRDRMLVFGGYSFDGAYHYSNEVWALSLGGTPAWTQIIPAGDAPPARAGHAALYDPVRDRLVLSGGYYFDGASHYLADLWALSLGGTPAWTQLAPAGFGRAGHSLVYDALGDRAVVFGGYYYDTAPHFLNDAWAFALSDDSGWSLLSLEGTAPLQRTGHAAVYDAPRERILVFGGQHGASSYLNDGWILWPASALSVPLPPAAGRLSLAQGLPNPSQGNVTIMFTLPRAERVALGIFDIAGRLISTPKSGLLPAGTHVARWDGRAADGGSVAPGVYLCTLQAGRERITRKLVRLR